MSRKMKNKKEAFKPFPRSEIRYSNGIHLRIDQVNARGACRVIDVADNNRVMNYTHSIEAAWSSVRYVGGVSNASQRSRGSDDYKIHLDLIPPPPECPSIVC